MNKISLLPIAISLAAGISVAEPLCLAPVEAAGVAPETQSSVPSLFKLYAENQGNYQITDNEASCSKTAQINVSKLGQATIVTVTLQDSQKNFIWSNQQKVIKEENIDKALAKISELMNQEVAAAPTQAKTEQPVQAVAPTKYADPIQPRAPRVPSIYFGMGLGLSKFIGDEINEFTDHEPLTTYDFFFAYDAKYMITMLNLTYSYKANTIQKSYDNSYYGGNEDIYTHYLAWGFSFYYPLLSAPITPYLGVGMAATNFNIEHQYSNHEITDNGLQAHVGGGILLNRNKRLNTWLHGEYFFNTYEPINHTFHGFSILMKVSLGV